MDSPAPAGIADRFRSNSALIIGMRGLTAALSLAIVPVLVSRFGMAGFGTWEAVLALAGVASVVQAAASGTLVWRMSAAFGRGDAIEITRLIRLGVAVTLALGAVLWPIAWWWRQEAVAFLRTPDSFAAVTADLFPVIVAVILLGGIADALEAGVSGCQRTGLVHVIGAVAHLLNLSSVMLLVLSGGGLWSLVAGQAIGLSTRIVGAWVVLRRLIGGVSLLPVWPERSDGGLVRYAGMLAMGSTAAALRDQTDKIILAALASPVWVGYYSVAARLAGLILEVVRFMYVPALTAVAAWHAMGHWASVRRLYGWLMRTIGLVAGLIALVVGGLVDPLTVLWIGEANPHVRLLTWWLLAGAASAAILTGAGTSVCRGCGRPGLETTYLIINLVLNVTLTIVLVRVIGPVGTAIATGVTWAAASLVFLLILHRALDVPVAASRDALVLLLLSGAVAAAVYWWSGLFDVPGSRRDALTMIVTLGAAGALVYVATARVLGVVTFRDLWRGVSASPGRAV